LPKDAYLLTINTQTDTMNTFNYLLREPGFWVIVICLTFTLIAAFNIMKPIKPTYSLNIKELLQSLSDAQVALIAARESLYNLPNTGSVIQLDEDIENEINRLDWIINDIKQHPKFYTETHPERLTEYTDTKQNPVLSRNATN
jgi:hypothetical protein